jgi:uncharacterized membrane protein
METHKDNTFVGNKPADKKEKNTGMAIVAYILFFVPLLTDAKNDPFVKYHVKQGLLIFILGVIGMIVGGMPGIQWFSGLINLVLLVLVILGIINAANGKEEPLPVIGHFADKFRF